MAETPVLTAYEAKCILTALIFGDPSAEDQADPNLEEAKRKLRVVASGRNERSR